MKFFSLLYQGKVHPSSSEKVIKADDYSKLLSAIEVLETAKNDAKEHIEKAKETGEEIKKQAQQEGFNEGIDQINQHIISIDNELKNLKLNLQQMVLPIALKAAKQIVKKELAQFPETIVDIVFAALEPIKQSHQVTIYVNKEDKDILEKEKDKLKEILEHVDILNIQVKDDISRGGCIIKTNFGMVNATIEKQLEGLEKAFARYKSTS